MGSYSAKRAHAPGQKRAPECTEPRALTTTMAEQTNCRTSLVNRESSTEQRALANYCDKGQTEELLNQLSEQRELKATVTEELY